MAFDGSGDQPSGLSALSSTAAAGFVAPPVGVPPPSYSESMLRTNPPTLSPSPRHAPVTPPLVADGSGLAPPPLYAPRDSAPDQPAPPTNTGVSAGASQLPSSSTSAEVSSRAPQAPQHSDHKSSVRASVSMPQPPVPPTSAAGSTSEGSHGCGGRSYTFEFSSSDSISTPTDSTMLTSPSLTMSEPDSPMRDMSPPEEASPTVMNSEQQTGSLTGHPQEVTSLEWPGDTPRVSGPQSSAGQAAGASDKFVADFSNVVNTDAKHAAADEAEPEANAEGSSASLNASPAVASRTVVIDAENRQARVQSGQVSEPGVVDAENGPARVESGHVSQVGASDTEHLGVDEEVAKVSQRDDDQEGSPPHRAATALEGTAPAPDVDVESRTLTSADGAAQPCASGLDPSTPTEQKLLSHEISTYTSITGEASPEITAQSIVSAQALSSTVASQPAGSSGGVVSGHLNKAAASSENIPDLAAKLPGPTPNVPGPASNIPGPTSNIPGQASDTPSPACENIPVPSSCIPSAALNIPGPASDIPGPVCENITVPGSSKPDLAANLSDPAYENIPVLASSIPGPASNIPGPARENILDPAPDFLPHQGAERTDSATSLPPPPSPHPCAGFDFDTENFPSPPPPLAADSDGHPQSPPDTDLQVPTGTGSPISATADPTPQLAQLSAPPRVVDSSTSLLGGFPSPPTVHSLRLPVADHSTYSIFDSLSLPISCSQVVPYSPAPSRADSPASVDSDSPLFARADSRILPGADSSVLSWGDSLDSPRENFPTQSSKERLLPQKVESEGAGYLGGAIPGAFQRADSH